MNVEEGLGLGYSSEVQVSLNCTWVQYLWQQVESEHVRGLIVLDVDSLKYAWISPDSNRQKVCG